MKETNITLLKQLNIPVIESIADLSYKLHLSEKLLYNLSRVPEYYYKPIELKKRNGDIRAVFSPRSSLRVIQSWILLNILEKISISSAAMGFRRGQAYGIRSNALSHTESEYILRIDLKNYFPSITRRMVYPIFNGLGYSQFISNVFTNYCMLNGRLPQGASTSPYLSNIVFKDIDEELIEISTNSNITYTRYADDLIFSSDSKSDLIDMIKIVEKLTAEKGFRINTKKTKIMKPSGRKIVTGVVVNSGQIKVKKLTKRTVRAMIFNKLIKENGVLDSKIKGYLSFIRFIEPDTYEKYQEYIAGLEIKKQSLLVAATMDEH